MKHSALVRSDQRYTSNVVAPLTVLADLICLLAAIPSASVIYGVLIGERVDTDVHVAAAVLAAVAFFLIRQSRGAYSTPWTQMESIDTAVIADYAIAALLSSAVIWQFGQLERFSRALSVIYVGQCFLTLLISRFVMRAWLLRLARRGKIGQRVILYSSDLHLVEQTCRLLRMQFLPQLTIVGVASDNEMPTGSFEPTYIGGLDSVLELARMGEVDQVFITMSNMQPARLEEIMDRLSQVSIDISVIPAEIVQLAPNYRVSLLGSLPILTMWRRPIRDVDRLLKRAEDLVVSVTAVVMLAPLLFITAVLIKLTSAGPILFVQPRFGFNNREIQVFKFRSMYVDRQDVTGAARTRKNDNRITPVGRIIRKLSIDELPQLWNVLKGEMSIVGPRPHAVHMKVGDMYYLDAVRGYSARHRVKPGITGLAQVRGLRGEIQTIERAKRRVELDIHYIDNWSLGLDFRIMLETAFGVIFDKNAY